MKKNEQDPKLSRLLRDWETPEIDLSNLEYNVRRRIAAERLEPRGWDRFIDLLLAWKDVFVLRPALGTAVAVLAVLVGSAGGFAVASSNTTQLAEHQKAEYARGINPMAQVEHL
jgi:hypothetical protein